MSGKIIPFPKDATITEAIEDIAYEHGDDLEFFVFVGITKEGHGLVMASEPDMGSLALSQVVINDLTLKVYNDSEKESLQ